LAQGALFQRVKEEVHTGFWCGNLKRPHGKLRRRWKDNIKMDLREVGWGMDWIWLRIGTGVGH
jgi:hypothetical protein